MENRIKGAYEAVDYADILNREWSVGIPKGVSTGFSSLDPFYTIKRKQWTVVSGMPTSGKSTFVDNVMISLARSAGLKFLVCSPENQPVHRHIETLAEIYSGKIFSNPTMSEYPSNCLQFDELAQTIKFIQDHFYFICPDDTDFHIEYILSLAEEIKSEKFDFDGFTLDPYNELEHKRPNGFTETEYISQLLTKVRRFVRRQDIHMWFVAHPTKQMPVKTDDNGDLSAAKQYQRTSLYDISGGAHWYNKCDNGVVIYRTGDKTTVAIDKIRFKECGTKGTVDFTFAPFCNRLIEK